MTTARAPREFNPNSLRLCPSLFAEQPPVLIFTDGNGYIFFRPPEGIVQPSLKVLSFPLHQLRFYFPKATSQCPTIVRSSLKTGGVESEKKNDDPNWVMFVKFSFSLKMMTLLLLHLLLPHTSSLWGRLTKV